MTPPPARHPQEQPLSPQILLTVLVALLLGGLASFGLYQAAQPAEYSAPSAIYTYGVAK